MRKLALLLLLTTNAYAEQKFRSAWDAMTVTRIQDQVYMMKHGAGTVDNIINAPEPIEYYTVNRNVKETKPQINPAMKAYMEECISLTANPKLCKETWDDH